MKYETLIRFKIEWFLNKQWWFQCSPEEDAYISRTYGHWVNEDYCNYKWDAMDKNISIAWVLVYDQLTRHVQRHFPECQINIEEKRQKAVQIVEELLKCHDLETFSGHEFGFLMLPYRHSYQWEDVYIASLNTWRKIYIDKANQRHDWVEELRPFIKATFMRYPMATIENTSNSDVYAYFPGNKHPWTIHKSNFEKILDHVPLGVSSSIELMSLKSMSMFQKIENEIKMQNIDKTILVSLSGGVDSMVILWILSNLKEKYKLNVVAIHINYCNREDIEENFVVSWCTSLGIDIYVRRIREIQRDICMQLELRQLYETYTRDCRYQAYHEVWKAIGETGNPWITMGHNQDDCFENILTNICHKQKYDELFGMTRLSENNQLCFWRPMLGIAKKDIYTFAKQAQIPYLHDSTPSWSCRGKIRDKVRPTLEEFHPEMVTGMFQISETMKELMNHVKCFVDIAIQNTMVQSFQPPIYVFDFTNQMPFSLITSDIFWRMYFMKQWNSTIRLKSMKHFCERMERFLSNKDMHKMSVVLIKGKTTWIEKIDSKIRLTFMCEK
jgi:tRNA(Ile)-lysidine synthetase-like protein